MSTFNYSLYLAMQKTNKIFFWIFGTLVGLTLLFIFVGWPIVKNQTKKNSPEHSVTYTQGDLEINTLYSSPGKKGRVIFGKLVPYDVVWRTGANEPTSFTTNNDLVIDNKDLPKGTYSLWTIPRETSWDIIFNSEMNHWGVKFSDQTANRYPKHDVLVTTVIPSKSLTVTENFTISFSESNNNILMMLAWDNTVVPVLIQKK